MAGTELEKLNDKFYCLIEFFLDDLDIDKKIVAAGFLC
jgi:hypothetical protein